MGKHALMAAGSGLAGSVALACVLGAAAAWAASAALPRAAKILIERALRRQAAFASPSGAAAVGGNASAPAAARAEGTGRTLRGDPFETRGMRWAKGAAAALFGASAAIACLWVLGGAAILGHPFAPAGWRGAAALCFGLACHAALLAAILCDVGARLIPWESSSLIGACGAAMQMLAGGFGSLALGALFGAACVVLCLAANRVGRALGRREGIGGGDVSCMAALSLASGGAACAGCLLSFLLAAAYSAAGCAMGKMDGASTMPMAPFFHAWFVVGVAGVAL